MATDHKRDLRRKRLHLLEREVFHDRPKREIRHASGLRSTLLADHDPDVLDVLEARVRYLHARGLIRRRQRSGPATRPAHEVRGAGAGGSYFTGRAVEYDEWSEPLYGQFTERIDPRAFDESLARKNRDIFATLDHDPGKLLGRESAGTLTLKPDSRGIGVEVKQADYSFAKDLTVALQRADVSGMSFIFDVHEDRWEHGNGVALRTVTKADLYEVSFVYFPAYPQTTAGLR